MSGARQLLITLTAIALLTPVFPAADTTTPAPQLLLLDGSDGTENTGWVRGGYAQEAFSGGESHRHHADAGARFDVHGLA